jgi:hypothetical protein
MVQHPALTDDRDLGDGESDSVVLAQFVWRVSIKLKTRTSSLGSEPVGANHEGQEQPTEPHRLSSLRVRRASAGSARRAGSPYVANSA